MVLVDVRAQYLLAAQEGTEILVHVEQVYESAGEVRVAHGCRRAVAGTSVGASRPELTGVSC